VVSDDENLPGSGDPDRASPNSSPAARAHSDDLRIGGGQTAEMGAEIESEPIVASDLFGDRIVQARRYVTALATDGVVRGLIGPREAGRLWSRHVLNSAVAAVLLDQDAGVVDIGSGAGLPGIPMAIARPDCTFFLVEPLERRTIFLKEIVAELALDNCTVVRGRAEQVVAECGESDVVTSRALAPLHRLAAWSSPLLRVGGKLLALKGSSAADEIERDAVAVAAVGLVNLEVVSVGVGVVDPATIVIRGTRIRTPAGQMSQKSGARGRKK
jgi:16S rRNA (guanine527-N7)-methyltransferase